LAKEEPGKAQHFSTNFLKNLNTLLGAYAQYRIHHVKAVLMDYILLPSNVAQNKVHK
jgi:hypothetical protein